MNYPESLKNLINSFKKLPGIGDKTAERLAFSIFEMDKEEVELFSKSIIDVKTKIKKCQRCFNITENDLCPICKDKGRDHSVICVLEEAKNVLLFEKMGTYNGLYHILDGLISPLDNINPEDLNLKSLFDRIEKEQIKEIIIAVKPSIEGETTSLYISKMLEGKGVRVSKIAHGVPLGMDMDYIDAMTLELALEERKYVI